ncbi:MAG: hypothetical protein LBG80_20820 [Bacteroidales bacterium]|jgi:hypothetical protein|nr:hypothetical protein [Bacteroidales bacterium]
MKKVILYAGLILASFCLHGQKKICNIAIEGGFDFSKPWATSLNSYDFLYKPAYHVGLDLLFRCNTYPTKKSLDMGYYVHFQMLFSANGLKWQSGRDTFSMMFYNFEFPVSFAMNFDLVPNKLALVPQIGVVPLFRFDGVARELGSELYLEDDKTILNSGEDDKTFSLFDLGVTAGIALTYINHLHIGFDATLYCFPIFKEELQMDEKMFGFRTYVRFFFTNKEGERNW